jgi:SAM-dependent methyltransferase
MREACFDQYKIFMGPLNLNVGSAKNLEKNRNGYKFVNLDRNASTGADVVHDLTVLPLPFPDSTFDSVVASHIFEHLPKRLFLPIIADIHRILKPGGHLLAFTPYATSFDMFENPEHIMAFTESTFYFATMETYKEGTAGFGAEPCEIRDWSVKVECYP